MSPSVVLSTTLPVNPSRTTWRRRCRSRALRCCR
jgi:hypothetical protein